MRYFNGGMYQVGDQAIDGTYRLVPRAFGRAGHGYTVIELSHFTNGITGQQQLLYQCFIKGNDLIHGITDLTAQPNIIYGHAYTEIASLYFGKHL